MSQSLYTHERYKKWFAVLKPIAAILYPSKVYGRENVTDKPCLVCANHSNYVDPVLVAIAFGKEYPIHFMAKQELFQRKWMANFVGQLGGFAVDRDGADISAVRAVMKYIRGGEKVGIFPEGTRVSEDGAVQAKEGAVRMAAKLRVPVIPVYVSRNKKIFRRVKIVIGEPIYYTNTTEDYRQATDELMETIAKLGRDVG